MPNEKYITKEESERCQKVADTYAKELEEGDIVLLNAGKFGFVMLQYFQPPMGFDSATTFTDSNAMFEFLWKEWLDIQLIRLGEKMCFTDTVCDDIFEFLTKEQQRELMKRKFDFAKKQELEIL